MSRPVSISEKITFYSKNNYIFIHVYLIYLLAALEKEEKEGIKVYNTTQVCIV